MNLEVIRLNQIAIKKLESVISGLLEEVTRLRNRIEFLEKREELKEDNVLIVQGSLKAIWDNEKDDIWSTL